MPRAQGLKAGFRPQNAPEREKTLESGRNPRKRRPPMAKKCWIERNKRKQKTVKKYADLRRKLKEERITSV